MTRAQVAFSVSAFPQGVTLTRSTRPRFLCQPLEELDRQLRFAPPAKREEQLRRAERLHDQIDPDINYPFDYIAYRITRYRRDSGEATLLVGSALLPDLRQMIDSLSRSVEIPFDDEPTETVTQLAQRLQVSTKTINRWRKAGLRWRWVVTPDSQTRQQVGITRRAMEQFAAKDPKRVARAKNFTQMTDAQRRELIDLARVLAESENLTLNQVADRLAQRTGRALETIRLLLQKNDRTHPGAAIFADHLGPLTDRQKRIIARAHRMGVAMDKLCQRFNRTRSTIYRAIHECRAAEAMLLELSWVDSPRFHGDDAQDLLRPPSETAADEAGRVPSHLAVDDLPAPLQGLYRQAPLSAASVRFRFLRYNYLKFRAATLRDGFDEYEVRAADLDQFDEFVAAARQLRSALVRGGQPTVLSVARRHLIGEGGQSLNRLLALLEIGLDELVETVEHYDAGRSQRFEAMLTNRLLRRFARYADDEEPRRAQRRLTDDAAVGRMLRLARRHRVDLAIDPIDPADRV